MASGSPTSASQTARTEVQTAPLPPLTRAELAVAFAQVLDLAEGKRPGHAARICYVTLNLARALDLPPDDQRAGFYAALLHDAGAAPASAELCRLGNFGEEAIFRSDPEKSPQQLAMELAPAHATEIVELLRGHTAQSADLAGKLGLDEGVQAAICAHHERWDGRGYPKALKGKAIPIAGRLVATADLVESLIASEGNALAARRNLLGSLDEHSGRALEPQLVRRANELARSDAFWLGLYREDLSEQLVALVADSRPEQADPAYLETFAAVFADLADAKGEHTGQHGRRTAELAVQLAEALELPQERRGLLRIATLLHDVGLLGVPARVIAKPDILSLTEMQVMRQHPTYSQIVLESLPGMEEAARWVGAHHERIDGKGYPEMLEDDAIPLEGRIIGLADTYVALTSNRPYRRALSYDDARLVLLGGAGTQLDRDVVQIFCALTSGSRSSQSARRLRRKR